MNREILFRGKRVGNGNWIEGYFVLLAINEDLKHAIYTGTDEGRFILFEVIPDTVGQFTGLCDKNGKKIFEGDIVRFYDKDWIANGIATVDFEKGRWKINGHYTTKLSSIVWLDLYRTGFEYEVIDNIYDNPELLEEKL